MVRAILWDADGVLQHNRDGWQGLLDRWGGTGFAAAVFAAEAPALVGERSMRDCLAEVLDAWPDATAGVEDLLGLWERAVVDEEARDLVGRVRASGVLCALATNQQDYRRAWMREVLGWDDHFDRLFYSCEMGVAKPDPAYFDRVLADLGLPPEEVGFVDDSRANVEAARAVGIRAVLHVPTSGAAALEREVAALLAQPLP